MYLSFGALPVLLPAFLPSPLAMDVRLCLRSTLLWCGWRFFTGVIPVSMIGVSCSFNAQSSLLSRLRLIPLPLIRVNSSSGFLLSIKDVWCSRR
ncbi:hypothetical protein Bca52824_010073 [Brassica carinata]|uniref:Uncharacterized protein n=1 Tax=Brassica carinata TaxID=52824 RepID=A0A8X7WED9_BRACI|nr:hypothetical protein Bca52824_010073 [Brassica carinata]